MQISNLASVKQGMQNNGHNSLTEATFSYTQNLTEVLNKNVEMIGRPMSPVQLIPNINIKVI